ncbi:hypothetical protein ACFYNO_16880 [Kitasatospora sp. NPDC006697]|uniref:hypothetical protein n=1 Tax=Kitasatospora sp. NPDC006697 TaxID=3364020 RepID=UPI00369C94D8
MTTIPPSRPLPPSPPLPAGRPNRGSPVLAALDRRRAPWAGVAARVAARLLAEGQAPLAQKEDPA